VYVAKGSGNCPEKDKPDQTWLNVHLEQEQDLRKAIGTFEQENAVIHSQWKPFPVSTLASAPTTTLPAD